MIIDSCDMNLSRSLEEEKEHGTKEFPVAAYWEHHACIPEDDIPWHWHREFELISVPRGRMEIQVPDDQVNLYGQNLYLINSNILHFCRAREEAVLASFVFSGELLSGEEKSVFARRYILPLTRCRGFKGILIDGTDRPDLICDFENAMEAMKTEGFGYEFKVRELLSHFLLYAAELFRDNFDRAGESENDDDIRIHLLLKFIDQHYSEPIGLRDIAAAAGISGRECQRLFQRMIRTSPVQYLMKYRIEKGAGMLTEGRAAIADIASRCGIDSPSNFSYLFRRYYYCTPQEYRKRNKAVISGTRQNEQRH